MPTSPSVSGRLNQEEVAEKGYESPVSAEDTPANFSNGNADNNGERRRAGYSLRDDVADIERIDPEAGTIPQTSHRSNKERVGIDPEAGGGAPGKVGIRDRIACYTWTWFTMNMATGGIANVLNGIPYRSEWLRIIGVVVFLFNLALFLMNCIFITMKFRFRPGSFKGSFVSPAESLFVPVSVVAFGTILINFAQYGIPYTGPWFHTVMQVLFWAYVSLSVIASAGIYLIIWSTHSFPIHMMTPAWIFPAYPLLLVAPLAANLIAALPDAAAADRINSIAIAFGAVCMQGIGFLVSLLIYSAFMYRLMTQKLPGETTRPRMFIAVGPSGFTVAGLVLLGNKGIHKISPNVHFGNENAEFVLKIISLLVGIWLWGLCLWFFLVSAGAHIQLVKPNDKNQLHFDMTWYSFVFPNTALVTATFTIAGSLESHALRIFGTVLAVMLVIIWIYVFGMMIRAIALKRILYPEQVNGQEGI